MKKFLLSCLCMLGFAVAANAADLYLRGSMTGSDWPAKAEWKFTETAGKYILENVTIPANAKMVVATSDWSTKYGEWDGIAKNMSGGNQYKCHYNGGDMTFGGTAFTGNVEFWLDGTAGWAYIKFVVPSQGGDEGGETPEVTYEYDIWGNFEGSTWKYYEFDEVITVTNPDAKFGVRKYKAGAHPAAGKQDAWYAAAEGTVITEDTETIQLITENAKDIQVGKGDLMLSLDEEHMTLSVLFEAAEAGGDEPETPEAKKAYLAGDFNNWTADDAAFEAVLGAVADNCYVWTIENWNAAHKFQVVQSSWFGAVADNGNYIDVLNNDAWVKTGGGYENNFTLNAAAAGKTVTITWSDDEHTICATWEEEGETPVEDVVASFYAHGQTAIEGGTEITNIDNAYDTNTTNETHNCASDFVNNGVTVTLDKGEHSSRPLVDKDGLIRFYATASASNTLTVSAASNIKSIVIECSTDGYNKFAEMEGLEKEGATATWTGSAKSVEFTNTLASSSQSRIKTIVVTLEGGEGEDPVTPPTPGTKVYAYLAGNFNEWNAADAAYKAEVVDNVATWTITATEDFQFKAIYEGTWYGAWTDDNNTYELPNDEADWYGCKEGGLGNNFVLPAAAAGKTVTIKFAVDNKDICTTWATGDVPTPGTEEKSFTIVYKNNDSDDTNNDISTKENAASLYTSSVEKNLEGDVETEEVISAYVEGSKLYNVTSGLKLGTNSAKGSLTISFNEDFVKKATKVIVEAKRFNNNNASSLVVTAGATEETFALPKGATEAVFADYTISLAGTADLDELTIASSGKPMVVKSIKVVWNEEATGIEAVESEANVAPVYYNLQGARVENPANGLYIVVRGNKVSKEIIR